MAHRLQLVCYPYLRKQLKTSNKRGFLGSVFARIAVDSGVNVPGALSDKSLANNFVEFEEWQNTMRATTGSMSVEERSNLLGSVEMFFSPPANGRPEALMSPAVEYDSKEYAEQVAPNVTGPPGTLHKLPALPAVAQHNLLAFLMNAHSPSLGSAKSVNLLNFVLGGNADYHVKNWDPSTAYTIQPGSVYNEHQGWQAMSGIQPMDSVFFAHKDQLHAGVSVGGNLILHKTSSEGPVWLSTHRELLELTARDCDVHVKPTFTGATNKFTPSS